MNMPLPPQLPPEGAVPSRPASWLARRIDGWAHTARHPLFWVGVRDMASVSVGLAAWAFMTGVAMVGSGMSVGESVLMSVLVFAGSAQLAALPLIAAGAPMWVIFAAARELSFDTGPEEPIDPGAVLAIVLSMMTIVVTGSAISGGEASQDIAGAIGSIFGMLGTLMTPPHAVPQSSFFFAEQWSCWGLNVLASVVQVADSQRAAGGLPSLGVLKGLSAYFGVCILWSAGFWHGLGFGFGEGDRHLAGLDLGNQILSGLNDFSPLLPSKAAPAATIASCVVGIGLGVENIRYSLTYPDAKFG